LSVATTYAGAVIDCPTCSAKVRVPRPAPAVLDGIPLPKGPPAVKKSRPEPPSLPPPSPDPALTTDTNPASQPAPFQATHDARPETDSSQVDAEEIACNRIRRRQRWRRRRRVLLVAVAVAAAIWLTFGAKGRRQEQAQD